MPARKVRAEDIVALKASGAFDGEWYCKTYPDVALLGIDPAEHFLWIGAKLGRSPLPPPPVSIPLAAGAKTAMAALRSVTPGASGMDAALSAARAPLQLDDEQAKHFDITDGQFWSIAPQVHDSAKLSLAELFHLYAALQYVVDRDIKGDVIECGMHIGDAIMRMAHVVALPRAERQLISLDTATRRLSRSEDLALETGSYADVPAHRDDSEVLVPATRTLEPVEAKTLPFRKADLVETLSGLNLKKIAILRLRTGTYGPTKTALQQLYDKVSIGGVVIVDDYGYAAGCKKAVDEFVRRRKVLLQRTNSNVRSWVKVFQ